MVCENRRLRSLLVSRRGGFLEDPFFRDAWGDYNNAVRRIVDRFNHGMFTPTERLRDSHYHSMYRTLRSARINYAAQAASFKDEGNHYKLVMDVREFLGGEITVRTAGGTLSVRGRLESDVGVEGDSAYSGISSRASSSSARTLHRRFNLPPDADGEKVQSTLSRDAVLTVTVDKRTDVRVIPVTVEGDTPPPSASASISGRSATKRHSATHPEPGPTPSKRSQENHYESKRDSLRHSPERRDRSTSRTREPFGMRRRETEQRTTGTEGSRLARLDDDVIHRRERNSRRGSDLFTCAGDNLRGGEDNRRKSYPDSSSRRAAAEDISRKYLGKSNHNKDENGSKRRTRETVEEEESEPSQRTRRRTSKYEEAKEFHIPIRFEDPSRDSDTVLPYSSSSPSRSSTIDRETVSSGGGKGASAACSEQSESPKVPSRNTKDTEGGIPFSSSLITKMNRDKRTASDKGDTSHLSSKDTSNIRKNLMNEKENIKPSKGDTPWVYSKCYQSDSAKNDTAEKQPLLTKKESATATKPSEEKKRYYFGDTPLAASNATGVEVRLTSPEGISISKTEKEQKAQQTENVKSDPPKNIQKTPESPILNKDAVSEKEPNSSVKDYLRTESQESADSVELGRKSPLEGREVTVEKKQSDMEGDMFKDCWQNFSSTLQEVLSRLQELSSELGPAGRNLGTSSSSPSSPPKSTDNAADSSVTPINKTPRGDAENGEISEHHSHGSIDGNGWAAEGETRAEGGARRTPPTSLPVTRARSVSPERSPAAYDDFIERQTNKSGARYMDDFVGSKGGGDGTPRVKKVSDGHHEKEEKETEEEEDEEEEEEEEEEADEEEEEDEEDNDDDDDEDEEEEEEEEEEDEEEEEEEEDSKEDEVAIEKKKKDEDKPLMQQVSSSQDKAKSGTGVPHRNSADSDGGGDGGVHQKSGAKNRGPMVATGSTPMRGVSLNSMSDPKRYTLPMDYAMEDVNQGAFERPSSSLPRNGTLFDEGTSSSVPRQRPTSLNFSQGGFLLRDLRSNSPSDALKNHFLSHMTSPNEQNAALAASSSSSSASSGDKDVHYIPVELEAGKRVTLVGGEGKKRKSGGGEEKEEKKKPPLSPTSVASVPCTPAATLPLCERRGRDIENLVIVEDDCSSNDGSIQVNASAASENKRSNSAAYNDKPGQRTGHSSKNIEVISGNSGTAQHAAGPGSFQPRQHSSSSQQATGPRLPGSYSLDGPGDKQAGEKRDNKRGVSGESPRSLPQGPSSSATSLSGSELDVDAIISQAEKVIRETKRLSASVITDLPLENDLGREKYSERRERVSDYLKPSGFNLAPNIVTRTSPESNFVEVHESQSSEEDEEEEEEEEEEDTDEYDKKEGQKGRRCREEESSVVEGCLSIPLPGLTRRPQQPRVSSPLDRNAAPCAPGQAERRSSVIIEPLDDDNDDVTSSEEVRPTIVKSPEIQSSDVMGCATEGGRRVGAGGRVGLPRDVPPSHTLSHETRPNRVTRLGGGGAATAPALDSSMGGVFTRGRTHDSSAGRPTPAQNVSSAAGNRTRVTSPAPPSPRLRERTLSSSEEAPLPPYVRQKPDPTRRYSGFGHIQSDNVRKMRDVWGSRQEPSPTPNPRSRAPAASPPPIPKRREAAQSPRRGPDSPRRFSDTSRQGAASPIRAPHDSPRRYHDYSPRRTMDALSSSRRGSDSPRRGPDSPKRGPDSPKRGPDSPKRSFFSRDSPSRDSGRSSKSNNPNSNFYSSTISSRNKLNPSSRRGSTSSTEGSAGAPPTFAQPSATRPSTANTTAHPQPDRYRSNGANGGKPSTPTSRRSRRTSTPPPPSSAAPPSTTSTETPTASPIHHKVFRKLRDTSLQPDSQTICFREEEDRYKLVMDVEEYVPGEVEVLQDDKELTVKGHVEIKHRGGNTTTRTFHRKFHIPHNSREEDIDSALSRDGILTVYVPKKRERVIKIELTD